MNTLFWRYSGYCVAAIALLCLYAILQIKFDFAFYIGTSENAEGWNLIIEGLSYSFIAAYIFYVLTVKLPYWETKMRVQKALEKKIGRIKSHYRACIESVLPMSKALKPDISEEEVIGLFKQTSYRERCRLSTIGMNVSISYYIKSKHEENQRIAAEILEYRPWLSSETIAQIEEIRNSDLSSIIIAMTNPVLADALDNEGSRETLAREVWKLWKLSERINVT